jgi:hypothetical protein
MTSERNATIIRLYRSGTRPVDLARQFSISRGRVRQIVKRAAWEEKWRVGLAGKYGSHPKIAALPDDTSIEVLCLCAGDIHGWAVRVSHLEHTYNIAPIKTLGDLRTTTDAQLLNEPNVGKKTVAELRRFCPRRNPAYGGKKYYKRRPLPTKLKPPSPT